MFHLIRKNIVEFVGCLLAFRDASRRMRISRRAHASLNLRDDFRKAIDSPSLEDLRLKLLPTGGPVVPRHAALQRVDTDAVMLRQYFETREFPGAVVREHPLLDQDGGLIACSHTAIIPQAIFRRKSIVIHNGIRYKEVETFRFPILPNLHYGATPSHVANPGDKRTKPTQKP